MPPSWSILLCGTDPVLLDTRRMLLERAGYRVVLAATPAEVARLAATAPVAMLLLCHSLTPTQMQEAMAAAVAARPETHVLVLTTFSGVSSSPITGTPTASTSRPAEFLASIARVVGQTHGTGPPLTSFTARAAT